VIGQDRSLEAEERKRHQIVRAQHGLAARDDVAEHWSCVLVLKIAHPTGVALLANDPHSSI
jgi:hypothetical protein